MLAASGVGIVFFLLVPGFVRSYAADGRVGFHPQHISSALSLAGSKWKGPHSFLSSIRSFLILSASFSSIVIKSSHSPRLLFRRANCRVLLSSHNEMAEVCPSPEELQYSGPVQCPVEGCEKELPSSACLRMHVARRHHGKLLERASGSRATTGCVSFFCPVKGCNRCREGGKSFSRLGQLKQVRDKRCVSQSHISDMTMLLLYTLTALPDHAWSEELHLRSLW